MLRGADAFRKVDGGAPFFVHDADLQGVSRQGQQVFDGAEQFIGKRDFVRSVHFGLDDVNRSGTRITPRARTAQVMQGDERGHRRIDKGLRYGAAVQAHGVAHHVVADVAHQHETAAGQHESLSARRPVPPIRIQAAQHGFAAFLDPRLQAPVHQSQPVSISLYLVLGIHRGDRILAILNRRDRRFQQHIADAGRIIAADDVCAIDVQFYMQPMVDQQQHRRRAGISLKAAQCSCILQAAHAAVVELHFESVRSHTVAHGIVMRTAGKREVLIQEIAGKRDDFRAALRIVGAGAGCAVLRNGVGAVQRIVEAAPAGIGRIQGVARIADRHHQLRPGDLRDLRIDMVGIDGERLPLGYEIANLDQVRLVARMIEGRARILTVPGIDLRLQLVASQQQRGVSRRQFPNEGRESVPKGLRLDTRARHGFAGDEVV